MDETSAAMLVHAFKLEAEQIPGCRLIAPQMFSVDPVEAARLLQKDPSLCSVMLKGLASKIFMPERLTLEQAVNYSKAVRPGVVGLPLLDDLAAADQAAKRKKIGPQKPTEISSNIGQECTSYLQL